LRVLQIDEWLGLPARHPGSCRNDLQTKLIAPLGITPDRLVGFATATRTPESECRRVSRWLETNGPIDLCILGLGLNGHVAMVEPAAELVPGVHVTRLSASSKKHPLLRSLERKPTHGLTLGIGDILRSRQILLLVSGTPKRAALERLLAGPLTTRFPASLLRLNPNTTVLCDRSAAGK